MSMKADNLNLKEKGKEEREEKLRDVKQVVQELNELGVDISTGSLEVSNKPKINMADASVSSRAE